MKTMNIWLFSRVHETGKIATLQTFYLPGTIIVIEGLHPKGKGILHYISR